MNQLVQNFLDLFPQLWRGLAVPLITFALVVSLGLITRRIVFARLRKWVRSTNSNIDDLIVESLHGPTMLWIFILGIHAATEVSALSSETLERAEQLLVVLWIIAITSALAKLGGRLVRLWGTREDGSPGIGTLGEVLASLLIGLLGTLTLLRALGIDITPVLTALGVGGLAVALALQDTLSNFFAGFYLSLAGQVRVGDFVKVESGQEGFVTDIGWRSITMRERSNNLIVIPNNKFAQAIVTNYHLPDRSTMLRIPVSVSYADDPDKVERILTDIASKLTTPGLLRNPAPFVRFNPGFGEYSLDFTLICQIADVEDQFLVQHEMRKEILRRFRQEGISIPFPTRTVEHKNNPDAGGPQ